MHYPWNSLASVQHSRKIFTVQQQMWCMALAYVSLANFSHQHRRRNWPTQLAMLHDWRVLCNNCERHQCAHHPRGMTTSVMSYLLAHMYSSGMTLFGNLCSSLTMGRIRCLNELTSTTPLTSMADRTPSPSTVSNLPIVKRRCHPHLNIHLTTLLLHLLHLHKLFLHSRQLWVSKLHVQDAGYTGQHALLTAFTSSLWGEWCSGIMWYTGSGLLEFSFPRVTFGFSVRCRVFDICLLS